MFFRLKLWISRDRFHREVRITTGNKQCGGRDWPSGIYVSRADGMMPMAISSTHNWQALIEADIIVGRLANIQIEP
jgi:hypothetical protein